MRARLKVSRAGVELIKSFEGLRTTAARLPDGRWTLGYGHTFSARDGARVTQEDADALLRFDLLPVVDSINSLVLVPLNQNQFDSLVSFCFNIGADNFAQSTVLKRINEGRFAEAALAMDSWRSAEFNGQTYVLAPLIRRRAAEKNLFLTPDDISHQAAALGRPVEDALESPAPVAPVETPPAPAPETVSYLNPYATPAPVRAAAAPPVRQMIDLAQYGQPPLTPAPESPVESLPQGLVSSNHMRETVATPIPPVALNPYAAPAEPQMSAEVQAAIARAQEEQRQRETAEREAAAMAQALAATRAAEEARQREDARLREESRLQEMQRAEAARLEQSRLEQARIEQDRLDQWRAEQVRMEQARLEEERQEAIRLEAEHLDQLRAEQARLEAERLEQARVQEYRWEQERLERERQAAARLEEERLEAARVEQVRIEAARLEAERAESTRLEMARLEAESLERERTEQVERARLQAAAIDEDATEKARKAEAAAALMRLYSPYGGGALGRPLGGALGVSAAARPVAAPLQPVSENVVSAPEPEAEASYAFTNHSLISPSTVESTPFEISSRADDAAPAATLEPEPDTGSVVDFTPVGSPAGMAPPVIMALNPYAKPVPMTPAADAVVEVPRPAPVNLSAPSNAPVASAVEGMHWRDQLQRPLPQDYQAPQMQAQPQAAQPQRVEAEQPFLRATPVAPQAAGTHYAESYDDDNESWMMNGERIALSSEDMEEEGDSWWQMIVKTLWGIIISAIGLGSLGVAAGAWWQATHDQSVVRNGKVEFYTFMSIGTAALGILFVSISVWLIMRRLGGLKD